MVKNKPEKKPLEQYDHKDKERINNPPVGLVTSETDKETGKKTYAYDPHLDPQLQWAGKAEHTSFEVPTVSLHVHERIDPITIIDAVRKRNGKKTVQLSLFESAKENPPLREAIEFYKHKHNWSNRLIAGDSLLVMNSLLEKEGMAGKVQMIYIDPPYGIKYGSNFQPFVNKRDVKDGKDEDLTQEPEMIKAFRDTWELGIHSYLAYLRDRLLLARELLTESGSVFVQISDDNVHHVRELMDDVFGGGSYMATITFAKQGSSKKESLDTANDFLLWYAKDSKGVKYHPLFTSRRIESIDKVYNNIELPDGKSKRYKEDKKYPAGSRRLAAQSIYSRSGGEKSRFSFTFKGISYVPPINYYWSTNESGLYNLKNANRLIVIGNHLRRKVYLDDFPLSTMNVLWLDTMPGGFGSERLYVVQTASKVIARCLLMTTDPGDLVLDPTCGSGTTAYVAEK
ncbi:MAG: site-specific DNA-methyltransferase [Methanophagales archaeon]|nr:site-specific DNA-methyltransferase [Methanophagales archaeon]